MSPDSDIPIADDLKPLLQYAARAPSSHNTQPWYFRVSGNRVFLYADRTKALPVNDPEDRELTISCGCALINLRVAAAKSGLIAVTQALPDPQDADLLATVELRKSTNVATDNAELFPAIADRRTYRKRFEPRALPHTLLEKLSESVSLEGAWLEVLTDENTRQAVAKLVMEGDAIQWNNPSWRRELAAWMHSRRRGDGLTVPDLVAPVAQIVVRTFDMGNGVGAKDWQLAEESPVLVILGTDRDVAADWLSAGQALERLLLTACRHGLQGSFLNQPIQVASLRTELQRTIAHTGFPQLLVRFGFASEELPATPRRKLEQVMEYE